MWDVRVRCMQAINMLRISSASQKNLSAVVVVASYAYAHFAPMVGPHCSLANLMCMTDRWVHVCVCVCVCTNDQPTLVISKSDVDYESQVNPCVCASCMSQDTAVVVPGSSVHARCVTIGSSLWSSADDLHN